MSTRFHTIVTHHKPHLDEIAAIWLLRKFGEKVFPGIRTAPVFLWSDGKIPDGRSTEEWEKGGTLLLGVGGGRFDEHPTTESDRKKDDCVATLVAKVLGVYEDPTLEKILKYVLRDDTKGGGQPFDLAAFVKLLNNQFPDQPEKVMDWAMTALDAKFLEQEQFNSITPEEFAKIAVAEDVVTPNRTYRMVTVVSDNEQAAKFTMSERGGRADVVIIKRTTGNVQIFTRKQSGIGMRDIAQMLRVLEQEAKDVEITTDFNELGAEGKVHGAEEWFYHLHGQMLLNGSLTAKGVPPTRIPLWEIQRVVRIGINPDAFQEERSSDCRTGTCTSTNSNPCSWYILGLQRCRKIRYEMRQAKK